MRLVIPLAIVAALICAAGVAYAATSNGVSTNNKITVRHHVYALSVFEDEALTIPVLEGGTYNWSTIDEPLFPGDSVSKTFWFRNDGDIACKVFIQVSGMPTGLTPTIATSLVLQPNEVNSNTVTIYVSTSAEEMTDATFTLSFSGVKV